MKSKPKRMFYVLGTEILKATNRANKGSPVDFHAAVFYDRELLCAFHSCRHFGMTRVKIIIKRLGSA